MLHSWFFWNLLVAAATAVLWLLVAYALSFVTKRHATIDIFWSSGFSVIYGVSLLTAAHHCGAGFTVFGATGAPLTRLLVAVALVAWSLRLSIYLAIRQRGHGEDSRYVWIMKGARGRNPHLYALTKIYSLQMALMWFISIPLQTIATARTSVTALGIIGAGVMAIGLGTEAVGDAQLRAFLKNPANAGTTMRSGLWRYTRHPNYFGDAVLWWGIYAAAASTGLGALSVLSPLAMTRLLTSISGKPLLEAKLTKTRAGYDEYVATTSGFLPRRPKAPSGLVEG